MGTETLAINTKHLKLKGPELRDLLDDYDNTRKSKSALAREHGISRVTLDFYLQNRSEIQAQLDALGHKRGAHPTTVNAPETIRKPHGTSRPL